MYYETINERRSLEQDLPLYQAIYDQSLEKFLDFRYTSKYKLMPPKDYARRYKRLERELDDAAAAFYGTQALLKRMDWDLLLIAVDEGGIPETYFREVYLGEHLSDKPSTFNPYFEAAKPRFK